MHNMTNDKKVFIYSGTSEPRLLRPAQDDEMHIWLQADGTRLVLELGAWVPFAENAD